ncbi:MULTISPECIES: TonB-dependent receptor [Asticcacaulis]|uniref:TonB-dependent receptor n=1 Tax=Asticcacaulis TaxID=76890 RepID=UPI001AEB33FD|nr:MULTISPECIES: TonB-dependent receptor [Asticcacaulis]MBP2161600.1 iron complex outermembrane receptor protein [Asticcacaulis solisilvae]MDR6802645.1 iron complex outermembrane receptor protein [Asticcacaulis sp. BE141]
MKLKRSILMSTAIAGAMLSCSAFAQDNVDDSQDVVVIGIRGSLQKAAQLKKRTDAIVDAISAEDVSKFPDTNIAESLSHLPGVSVDRNFGEGEKVSIHGTDPALNRILVDGHSIASADWGGNPNDPTSRTFNYSLMAPEIVGQLKVYKNPEPWIDEGSLGGTVILETRKPLDLKAGTVAGSLGYSYNDRSEKGDIRGSALYSWRNSNRNFGVLVAATYDKQQLHRAGIEYFGYMGAGAFNSAFTTTTDSSGNITAVSGPNINGAAPTVASYTQLAAANVPCCFNWAYFDQTRERKGLSAAVQWKPSDDTEFDLSALHIEGDYTNYNQSMYAVPVWNSANAQNFTVANGLISGAYIPAKAAGTGSLTQYDAILRSTVVKTDSINLAGKWQAGDWKISGNVGWTQATGGKEPERMISFDFNSGFTFGFTSDSTNINYDTAPTTAKALARTPSTTPSTINGVTANYVQMGGMERSRTTDKETYGQIDFKRSLEGVFETVMFGAKLTKHENSLDAEGWDYFANKTLYLSDFASENTPDGLWADMGGSGNAMQYLGLTQAGIFDVIDASVTRYNGPKYGMEFTVKEDIAAAYLQGNFRQGNWHGNVGGRLVSTEDVSNYWETADGGVTYTPMTVTQKETKFLPSANIVYDASDNVLLKFGAAKVIARPRYSQLAGTVELNDRTLTGGGGNANLKPYESLNFEGSVEWYVGKSGLFAAEFFHRKISSYVVQDTQDKVFFNRLTGANATYSFSSPFNAQDATVTGFALQAQKDIAYGFGIIANYTFADADTGTTAYNMPYLSRDNINIIPYYEQGPWQVRLSYNYRSQYFTGIGRRNSKDFTDSYEQVDLSASFKINDNLSIYANGQNLLDQTYYSFSSFAEAPTAFYKNGRRFFVGVNYKM